MRKLNMLIKIRAANSRTIITPSSAPVCITALPTSRAPWGVNRHAKLNIAAAKADIPIRSLRLSIDNTHSGRPIHLSNYLLVQAAPEAA
jgi:hypothetical protein